MNTPLVAESDRSSVYVDELIVEQYGPPASSPAPDLVRPPKAPRARQRSVITGLTALGALAIATVLLKPRYRRKLPPSVRLLMWAGLARLVARLGMPL